MSTPSPFLELPPELRNLIYDAVVLADGPPRLKRRQRPHQGRYIIADSGLILANQMVANEYYSVLRHNSLCSSTPIVAPVLNCNFKHTMQFFSLEYAMASARDRTPLTPRKLIVELTIESLHSIHPEHIPQWEVFSARHKIEPSYAVDNVNSTLAHEGRSDMWVLKGNSDRIYRAVLDLEMFRNSRRGTEKWAAVVTMPRYTEMAGSW